jgi:hypothetical protein
MTVSVTFKITRPSLDHSFVTEDILGSSLLAISADIIYENARLENPQTGKKYSGIIEMYSDESISWKDIRNRKHELRPDLKTWLEGNELAISRDFQTENDESVIGPVFNPFSLTATFHTVFDTIENARSLVLNLLNTDGDTLKALERTSNVTQIYLDGTLVDPTTYE